MKASLPLGVDILEWKKARAFYRAHRDRLDSLFTSAERDLILRSRRPIEAFARIFCAKEAVFKATERAWLGVHGFKRLCLKRKGRAFSFRERSGARELVVTFQRTKRHLVALCRPAGF